MENYETFSNKYNNFFNQNIYNKRNLNAKFGNYNNNNNNNMGMNFNKDSNISKKDRRINMTPGTKGQYSNRGGNPYYNGYNMKNNIFNSPAAPTFDQQSFLRVNNIQPFNFNKNICQNQPINTNNIKLNNNYINTSKNNDNKINNFINNNNNNNNNTNSRNKNNSASTEEDYTLEALKSKRIFRANNKNFTPVNQKLHLKNIDNNITGVENGTFCRGSTNNNNNNRSTVFYINQAFSAQK